MQQLTETIREQFPTHLILKLNGAKNNTPIAAIETLPEKVIQIQAQMTDSPIFGTSMKEKLNAWFVRFQQDFLPNLTEFDDKVNAAFALCYLLFGAIYPEQNKQKGDDELDTLFLWEDKIKEFLYSILPIEVDRESFIENYGKFFEEEKTVEEKINFIKACYQEQQEALLDNASAVNEQIQTVVEKLKNQLRELNSNRKTQSEAIHQRLDTLTEKVNSLAESLKETIRKTTETGIEFEKVQQKYQQIITL